MGIDFTHVNGARGEEVDARDDGRRRRGPRLRRRREARPPLRLGRVLAGRSARPRRRSPPSPSTATRATSAGGLPHFRNVTREAGPRAGLLRDGRLRRATTTTTGATTSTSRPSAATSSSTTSAAASRRSPRRPASPTRAGAPRRPGSTTTATACSTSSSAVTSTGARRRTSSARSTGSTKSYCTPERYPGTSSHLYRNLGGGRFEDVTNEGGHPATPNQKALGVAPWDFDGDGRIDLLVANDTAPNNLFRNQGDGIFEDVGDPDAGVAVDEAGRSRGAMGAAWARHEERQGRGARDRQLLQRAQVPLLDRDGRGLPRRVAAERRRPDLASRPDLRRLLLRRRPRRPHGPAPRQRPRRADRPGRSRRTWPTGRPRSSTWNAGDGRFEALGARSGDLAAPLVARGAAYADLDGDGDLDVILVENGGPARVYLNPTNAPNRSVRLRLAARASPTATPSAPASRPRSAAARSRSRSPAASRTSPPPRRRSRSASAPPRRSTRSRSAGPTERRSGWPTSRAAPG